MTSELWLWMTLLFFCFLLSSPFTCCWNDSLFHLLFSRHRLCPEGAYRTWNISQNATFKLLWGMELSSSLVTHVCWSVPSFPLGKSTWDVQFIIGRWVGKRRFETRNWTRRLGVTSYDGSMHWLSHVGFCGHGPWLAESLDQGVHSQAGLL